MKIEKENFIAANNWVLSLNASFQRVKIYKKVNDKRIATDKEVGKFKRNLKVKIEEIAKDYLDPVSEKDHIKNIFDIQEFSKGYSSILNNGYLLFGICQKLLNLYLKQLWVIDKIPIPPHFPVDRIIQELLIKQAKSFGINSISLISWTKLDNQNDYLKIIELAKSVRDKLIPNKSISELELQLYNQSIK